MSDLSKLTGDQLREQFDAARASNDEKQLSAVVYEGIKRTPTRKALAELFGVSLTTLHNVTYRYNIHMPRQVPRRRAIQQAYEQTFDDPYPITKPLGYSPEEVAELMRRWQALPR